MGKREQRLRERWFKLGADEFARVCPDAGPDFMAHRPEQNWPAEPPPFYACPLCAVRMPNGAVQVMMFQRAHCFGGHLTLEHAPAESIGGTEMALTCEACNGAAGRSMDIALSRYENAARFFERRGTASVALVYAGMRIGAEVDFTQSIPRIDPKSRNRSYLEQFWDSIRAFNSRREPLGFRLHTARHDDPLVSTSLLRSAYVVAFALFGYRYVFHPDLDAVRQQIRDPSGYHVSNFIYTGTSGVSETTREVFGVTHPGLPTCLAVGMGRRMVLLPVPGQPAPYDAAGAVYGDPDRAVSIGCADLPWPSGPSFRLKHWFDNPRAA